MICSKMGEQGCQIFERKNGQEIKGMEYTEMEFMNSRQWRLFYCGHYFKEISGNLSIWIDRQINLQSWKTMYFRILLSDTIQKNVQKTISSFFYQECSTDGDHEIDINTGMNYAIQCLLHAINNTRSMPIAYTPNKLLMLPSKN